MWDISKLPDNIKIEVTKADLLTFAHTLLDGMAQNLPPPKLQEDEILDFNGMCKFLGIAQSTGYAKTSNGEIPHFKKGRKLWFKKSELVQWIEEGRRKTTKGLDELAEMYLKNWSTCLFKL